jgi:hypothetical protein
MDLVGARDWKALARECKVDWVRRERRPDMPPVVIAERPAGTALAMVIAPRVDRDLGLRAAALLRRGFDAARLIFIVETYMEVRARGRPSLEPSELQRRWEAGERGTIVECLSCFAVDASSPTVMALLPFEMGGRRVVWLPEPDARGPAGGLVPDELGRIMSAPPLRDHPLIAEAASELGFDEERALFHSGRAGLSILAGEGFRVFDLVTARHPDWTERMPVS